MARRDNPGAAKPGGGIVSARCEFSDLDPVACAHCRGGDPFPDVRRRTTSPSSRLLPARFHGRCGDRVTFNGTADAVWYRRQNGITRACIGTLGLWSHYLPRHLNLDDPHDILTADLDGRYGGDCHGRWDGQRYWGAQEPAVIEQHLALLRPMLTNYPNIPAGYDGWWRF